MFFLLIFILILTYYLIKYVKENNLKLFRNSIESFVPQVLRNRKWYDYEGTGIRKYYHGTVSQNDLFESTDSLSAAYQQEVNNYDDDSDDINKKHINSKINFNQDSNNLDDTESYDEKIAYTSFDESSDDEKIAYTSFDESSDDEKIAYTSFDKSSKTPIDSSTLDLTSADNYDQDNSDINESEYETDNVSSLSTDHYGFTNDGSLKNIQTISNNYSIDNSVNDSINFGCGNNSKSVNNITDTKDNIDRLNFFNNNKLRPDIFYKKKKLKRNKLRKPLLNRYNLNKKQFIKDLQPIVYNHQNIKKKKFRPNKDSVSEYQNNDINVSAAEELHKINNDAISRMMGPTSIQKKLINLGVLNYKKGQFSEPRLPSKLKKSSDCKSLHGHLTGFEPKWYDMLGPNQPCQVIKYPGIWYDKDGWYIKYYDLLSNKFKIHHLNKSPNIYQKPHRFSVLNSIVGDKTYS